MVGSVQSDMQRPVFDRMALRARRARAAARLGEVDFLIRAAAERLLERVRDVRREFPLALDLGCHTGQMATLLGGCPQIGRLLQADLAHEMVRQGLAIRKEVAIPVCDVSCAKPPASHFRGFRGFRGEML